jgi:hypothetical protein
MEVQNFIYYDDSWFQFSTLITFMNENDNHPLWLHCIHVINSTSMKLEKNGQKIKNVKELPTYV